MLNELQNAFGLLDYRKDVIINGHLITISVKEGIGYGKQLSSTNNNFLYTLKVYEDAVPNTLYIEIDSLGNFLRVLRETEGSLNSGGNLYINTDFIKIYDQEKREVSISKLSEVSHQYWSTK
ncbi:hypothetical protein V7146_13480 [Gottfriedia acidiceleris]|uniref:hypothetical protein n=1 Tax=Gottfriedia acidiceleris TaxID=371036 RepID=UPI003000F78B